MFDNDEYMKYVVVNQNGWALEYASEELKKDKDFILEAVMQNKDVLNYISNIMREYILNYFSSEFENEKTFNMNKKKL